VSAYDVESGLPPLTRPASHQRTAAPLRGFLTALLVVLTALSVAAAAIEELLVTCLACHGEQGQSVIPEVPSLGAQPAFYVTVQLYMFRERLRTVGPMHDMLHGLSDDDLRRLAEAM
jgi:cytochrome c553